jgi:hypothetical protein
VKYWLEIAVARLIFRLFEKGCILKGTLPFLREVRRLGLYLTSVELKREYY